MAEVKLIAATCSPYSQRVHIALLEKGIPFEMIVADLNNKSQLLLDANPIHKKVPVLIHNGKPIAESLAILQYLEDAWPDQVPLIPTDAYEKSQNLFWAEYIYSTASSFRDAISKPRGSPEQLAAVEACNKVFKTLEEAMMSFSHDGPFFTGDKFGFIDVVMGPVASRALGFKEVGGVHIPGPEELPRFHRWMHAAKAHPSIKAALPTEEETLDFFLSWLKRRANRASDQ